jgi:hypothetical protein
MVRPERLCRPMRTRVYLVRWRVGCLTIPMLAAVHALLSLVMAITACFLMTRCTKAHLRHALHSTTRYCAQTALVRVPRSALSVWAWRSVRFRLSAAIVERADGNNVSGLGHGLANCILCRCNFSPSICWDSPISPLPSCMYSHASYLIIYRSPHFLEGHPRCAWQG